MQIDLTPNSFKEVAAKDKIIQDTLSYQMGDSVGGWTMGSDELSCGGIKIQSTAQRILLGLTTEFMTGTGIFEGKDNDIYKWRVGDPAGQYVSWNGSVISLKGSIDIQNPGDINGSDINNDSGWTSDYSLNEFIAGTYASDITSLQNQVDGVLVSWFYEGEPTLLNLPASDWTNDTLKNDHLGDLYYDLTTGYAYRFILDVTYQWYNIPDSGVAAALAAASAAQDTADGKRRVFTAEPTTPYDVGDLWLTSLTAVTGDLKKCITAKATGTYNASHWVLATGYTEGADWNSNLSNIPGTLATPSGDGLYLSSTYLGYYASGQWNSYIQNNGNFFFKGDGNTSIDWNITTPSTLTIKGGAISGGTVGGVAIGNVTNVSTSGADAVPSGLSISLTGVTSATDGTQSAYAILTWTAISTSTFDHYLIRFKKHAYTYYTYLEARTNTITIDSLIPNISYDYGIASVNKYGTASAFSTDVTGTTASDTTAPATVTAGSATAGIQYVILEWTHNTETDLASYNIYRNTSNNSGTASLIGNCRTNYFVDGGRTGGQIYYYWLKAIDTSGNVSANFSTVKSATPRLANAADVNISNRGWTQTCVFSVTDTDTVAWAAGIFTAADGTSYNIGAGNTGNMAAKKFIYLDIAVSTTAYQTTTTATTSVGDGKVLIAVAQNNTTEAIFQVLGGNGGMNIDASSIVTGSITTNEIAANTIVAGNIAAGTITATQIATGTITGTQIANGTVASANILSLAADKVLIDGAVYLSNWRASGDVTKIDGGNIYTGSVTTTQLNFTPVQSTDVIAKINASAEGITIEADNISISGSTTFSAGYDPTSKRRVFTAEPTSPYDIGDLWASGVFLKKCKTARASGAYNATEWEYATGYTDDTVANSKITTFAQNGIPISISAGDFWIDTDGGNQLYRSASIGANEIKAGEWVAVPDQNKLGGTGSSAVGGSYSTAANGARVLIFPDANTGFQVIDNSGNDVLKIMIGDGLGTIGDLVIGNWAGDQGIYYDKSAGTTTFKGNIAGSTITGGVFQTATTGKRIVISPTTTSGTHAIDFYNDAGDVGAMMFYFTGEAGTADDYLYITSNTFIGLGGNIVKSLYAGGADLGDVTHFWKDLYMNGKIKSYDIDVGSVLACNTVNTFSEINSTTGTKFLKNTNGVISWDDKTFTVLETPTGRGGMGVDVWTDYSFSWLNNLYPNITFPRLLYIQCYNSLTTLSYKFRTKGDTLDYGYSGASGGVTGDQSFAINIWVLTDVNGEIQWCASGPVGGTNFKLIGYF